MKKFNLEAALAGDPIQSREGRKARILAANVAGSFPIVAALARTNGVGEDVLQYTLEGSSALGSPPHDLYMVSIWEPLPGSYYVSSKGDVRCSQTRDEVRLFGLERQSKMAAETALQLIRTHLKLLAFVDNMVGKDKAQVRDWCVVEGDDGWRPTINTKFKVLGGVYMPEAVAKLLVEKLTSGEVVL